MNKRIQYRHYMLNVVAIFFSIFLPGCLRRTTIAKRIRHEQKAQVHAHQIKADIHVPLGLKVIKYDYQVQGDILVVWYESDLSYTQLAQEYDRGMEYAGWRKQASWNGPEAFLSFVRPGRFCTVFLKPLGKKNKHKKAITEVMVVTGKAS